MKSKRRSSGVGRGETRRGRDKNYIKANGPVATTAGGGGLWGARTEVECEKFAIEKKFLVFIRRGEVIHSECGGRRIKEKTRKQPTFEKDVHYLRVDSRVIDTMEQ